MVSADRFTITVNVAPVPCGRPRVVRQPGRGVCTVMPKRTVEFEQTVRLAGQAARPGGWNPEGFFRLDLEVRRARRAGDVDNFAKGVMDALNRVAWDDDSHVLELNARLVDGAGVVPGITATIVRLERPAA